MKLVVIGSLIIEIQSRRFLLKKWIVEGVEIRDFYAADILNSLELVQSFGVIIAHRMRTVAGADKIVVLADDVADVQGAPDELYKRKGIYATW